MKYFILFILTFSSINFFPQESSNDLFQKWYLHSLYFENPEHFIVSEISPSVAPSLLIMDNLDFSGAGSCNTFEGKFKFTNPDNSLETNQFLSTNTNCEFEIHNRLESVYFDLLQSLYIDYKITNENDHLVLEMNNAVFVTAIFKNKIERLSLPNFESDLNQIKIYSTKDKSSITIESEKVSISRAEIYNINGQNFKIIEDMLENNYTIDLPKGFYLIKLFSSKGNITKKILIP